MDFRTASDRVSIIQVEEHLSYQYNKSKGKIRPQYEHPSGDKIIVSNPHDSSRQMYFNRDGSNDKGSVIDFIKHRLYYFKNISYQKDMDGVNQVLKQFANEPIVNTKHPKLKSRSSIKMSSLLALPQYRSWAI